ncbi:hypothetical protein SNE40_003792 [Patella caerulea]|uniref:PiggyBac transposable element-derived protein domain-containing protein n=1 Tax=Patella caerulea TaxID=87958 RepID=A0AAN8KEZ4_PATCE
MSDKDLKKQGRGAYDYRADNNIGIGIIKWNDNKPVTLVTSCAFIQPVGSVGRYDKQEKKRVPVEAPNIIKAYNKHMGGVDLADMAVTLYRTLLRTKRY